MAESADAPRLASGLLSDYVDRLRGVDLSMASAWHAHYTRVSDANELAPLSQAELMKFAIASLAEMPKHQSSLMRTLARTELARLSREPEPADPSRLIGKRLTALSEHGATFALTQLPTGNMPVSIIPSHIFSVVLSQRLGLPLPYAFQQLAPLLCPRHSANGLRPAVDPYGDI